MKGCSRFVLKPIGRGGLLGVELAEGLDDERVVDRRKKLQLFSQMREQLVVHDVRLLDRLDHPQLAARVVREEGVSL